MSDPLVAFIPPGTGKYRVRIPGDIAQQVGWPRPGAGFPCFGFFRSHGELLCTAQEQESPARAALLRSMIRQADTQDEPVRTFADVPDAAVLVAQLRVIEFRAIWLKPPHTELELQLSTRNLARLGWHSGATSALVALAYSRVLVVMSEASYASAHTTLDI